MNNISDIHNCYGCGVCSKACPQKIIDLRLNEDGFYEPYITDVSKCTECRLCRSVCSFLTDDLALAEQPKACFAAWSKDNDVRLRCSSGGVGFEIGRTLLGQGFKVCGVRYDAEAGRAEHYVATTAEELMPSMGSKYIQSYTVNGFSEIDRKQKYLVAGTPCQIDSFRRYIRKFHVEDNFVLMDFFCHGVPSMWMWQKYICHAAEKAGKVTYVSWRNKQFGWHDSWAMGINGLPLSRWTQGDAFYKLFLGNYCLNKPCYFKCKFKYDHSSADIRIGDFWGKTYKDDERGVSGAIAFTQRGTEILESTNCHFVEHPFEVVGEGQIKSAVAYKPLNRVIQWLLNRRWVSIPMLMLPFSLVKAIKKK